MGPETVIFGKTRRGRIMGKRVHYFHDIRTSRCESYVLIFGCGTTNYLDSRYPSLFTNHKPDVTCLRCKKKLEKEEGDG